MANAKPNSILQPDERRRRIAELLCKAIRAGHAKQGIAEPPATASPKAQITKGPVPTDEERVLNYLRHVEQTTPRDLRAALGLPRTTLYRILLRLNQQDLIGTAGNARAVTHRLVNRNDARSGAAVSVRRERPREGARVSL